jgi:DNA-directed RNA polymerase specialized sigma24 family protein
MDSRAEAGFADFMRGRWSALVRLGYGLTGDLRLAEALAGSAFAKAYASWPRVLRAGDPNGYVCRVMLNTSPARFRSRRAPRPGPARPGGGGAPRAVPLRYWMDMTEAEAALGTVFDAVTPSEPPVTSTVRKGKIIQAGRSIGIVTGLAVVAGIGVGTPGLLRDSVGQAVPPARPTVVIERICPNPRDGVSERTSQPELVTVRVGELPGAELAAGSCAWLKS